MSDQTHTAILGDGVTNVTALLPEHLQDLENSGLSHQTIARLGFTTVRPQDLKVHRATSAYRIPYFDLEGEPEEFERLKLLPPVTDRRGRQQKYHQATGTSPHPYLPSLRNWRRIAGDSSVAILLTEGEKKAAKACQEGFAAIGISGVWNWIEKTPSGEKILSPMLDQFVWRNRLVEIVPDSDAWRADKMMKVLVGFYALGMELVQRGAIVVLVKLPETSEAKVGLDDWLLRESPLGNGSWERLARWHLDDTRLRELSKWWHRWKRKQTRAGLSTSPSLIDKVNSIRSDDTVQSWERRRQIAELVLTDLHDRGKLIRSSENDLLFFDQERKTLESIGGSEFLAGLYDRFGLNPTESETRFVEQEITTFATVRGDRMEVHRLSHWSEKNRKLYVSMGGGSVALLDGTTITFTDNGVDGILFRDELAEPPLRPDLDADVAAFDWLFDGLSLAGEALSVSHTLSHLKVWTLALFFPEKLKVRPILALIGEQGSGKTSFGRRLGLAVFGPRFEVSSFRSDASGERDFLAAVTSQRVLVYDNADSQIRWLPDHLARLSTGAAIQLREFYTTNTLKTYVPNCYCMLTSRDPRWNREDISTRLLPIRMETISTSKIPEVQLQHQILTRRAWFWGSLLKVLNNVVRDVLTERTQFDSSHRLADYHAFGTAASRALGLTDIFEDAIVNLDHSQHHLLAEANPSLELIGQWCDAALPSTGELIIPAGELFTQLRGEYRGRDKDFPFKDTYALGTWLGKNKRLLDSQCGVIVKKPPVERKRSWIFVRGSEEQGAKVRNI